MSNLGICCLLLWCHCSHQNLNMLNCEVLQNFHPWYLLFCCTRDQACEAWTNSGKLSLGLKLLSCKTTIVSWDLSDEKVLTQVQEFQFELSSSGSNFHLNLNLLCLLEGWQEWTTDSVLNSPQCSDHLKSHIDKMMDSSGYLLWKWPGQLLQTTIAMVLSHPSFCCQH